MGEFLAAAAAMDDFDFEGFDPDNLYTDMDTIIRILAEDPKPSVTIKGIYQGKSALGEEQVYPVSDASHNMALETSSCSTVMDVDMNDTNRPRTIVQENHSGALSMSSSVVPDILLPDTICTETNSRDASDIFCNPSNTCLKLWRDCTSGAEIASRHTLHDDPFLLHEKDSMVHKSDGRVVQQFPFENSYLTCTLDGSLSTTTPKVPVIDFYAPLPGFLCSEPSQCGYMTFKRESSTDSSSASSSRNFTSNSIDRFAVNIAEQMVSDFKTFLPNKKQKILLKEKWKGQIPSSCYQQYENSLCNDAVRTSLSRSSSSEDDDADIPKLDDISVPVNLTLSHMKLMSQQYGLSDSYLHGSGVTWLKADDERLTFQIALQDLSQTTSEVTPPDGLLAVPLLRHQRIALSWMVQKETASLQCCGGILADDQGFGKTISMIALILKERAPSSRSDSVVQGPDKLEALTLDDDNGSVSDLNEIKQPQSSSPGMTCWPIKKESFCMTAMGRPAARTLVVCPTSVLRQWADELQNKVTSKANLSFLVYHGSNRTRDPIELTKYDVVLTTYAIVSKEVPKQPIVVKDDEDRGTVGASCPSGLSARKQKKKISNSNLKHQDSPLLEVAGPLGRVGWFRVILDKAQSIKNHKTQVARACWGLRAKRRWCLSGTPIQNAVDDLYSYFRFLRYDPYVVYRSFCSKIKTPISRNPTTGYQKLQAVLKTIMLRRTKGTLIDGKPITDLPPKMVTLMKVDFSEEERAFYSTLECESRKQFKEYAAAGTVKKNYVNILLMLLRLRLACDHPFLITSYDSNSTGMSLKDMAKKLPRDRQITLLSCLEACLAICAICNDPPEDAVVTICGHVFCNQCICKHLTGDDSVCPSVHCKVRLTVASVFSRNTLKCCLAGLTDCDHSSVGCVSNTVSKSEIFKERLFSGSSKINAALEILQSLPITSCSSSKSDLENSCNRSTISDENAINTVGVSYSVDSDYKYRGQYKFSDVQATEKAIVFSQWTRMLDLLEVPLKASGIQFRRLDGTMSVNDRDKAVEDFNTLPEVTVMIMSLKAASLGLNMIAACHVLLLDLWWNPTTENQAIDRAHRIGQTCPVTVFRLTVRDTVEDRILALQEKKREMLASAFGVDESGTRQIGLTVEDLEYLFMA